ncbi:MAG: DUF2959 domain-containing protein [Phycisphaerales bacterium]
MRAKTAILLTFLLCLTPACSGIALREKLGFPKREQLVNRVEETRDAQEAAKTQFATTLEELQSLTGADAGDLEKIYDRLRHELDRSESRADAVREKIDSVERVGKALFKEWEDELDDYQSSELRRASAEQLEDTRQRYEELTRAMRRAESKMDPVLAAFADQVLFLKHNLNARAIASLDRTVADLEGEIATLIADMEASIAEANAFIVEMGKPEEADAGVGGGGRWTGIGCRTRERPRDLNPAALISGDRRVQGRGVVRS